jgi:hypothetical protein
MEKPRDIKIPINKPQIPKNHNEKRIRNFDLKTIY